MYIVVYDDDQNFNAAFKDGKLVRLESEDCMPNVQQTLFASAVACSLPKLAIVSQGGVAPSAAATVDGDSDFGSPESP
jgi:hypothetical protein